MYDYKEGKKRIDEILDNKLEVEEKEIPEENSFTYENGYYGWVTAIFIDIRNSSQLFTNSDKSKVSKIIRSFSSETIEILRESSDLREIGIRGDCVYAIYNTPYISNIFDIFAKSCDINTLIRMLNKLFLKRNFPNIQIGIGLSTAKELVVKAGRKGTGISNSVWIGDAVTKASNLSSLGNKNGINTIVLSYDMYNYIINEFVKKQKEEVKSWFKYHIDTKFGSYYDCDIVRIYFDAWVEGGML